MFMPFVSGQKSFLDGLWQIISIIELVNKVIAAQINKGTSDQNLFGDAI
jgi:hypothetical protein